MKRKMEKILVGIMQELRKQNIYYIEINGGMAGFFALLRKTLDYLCYADELGMLPYINYTDDNLYSEKRRIRGTKNTFEYYFEQPCNVNYPIFPWNTNVIKSNRYNSDEIEIRYNKKQFSYIIEESYIDKMAYIYHKYITLSDYTEKYIRHFVRIKLNHKKTLGVHIRGTDFNKSFNNHPVPVTVEEYVEKIQAGITKYGYEQVFVATDDKRCLEKIRGKFKVPLVYYDDVVRSENDKSVAFSKNDRKNHRYLLGLEVLRDAYTLVACSGFVGCLSQIDICVQIIKKSKGKSYQYLQIIDNGIFANEKNCWEPLG